MKKLQLPIFLAVLALLVLAVPGARGDTSTAVTNSGWYDHQIIQYKATAEVTSSPQAANLIAQGNIVYHIVDANGNTPAVHNGGAWNLQVFHWKNGVTPTLLNKDDDITTAANAGLGSLEITSTLVRCPVIDFSSLR